METTEVIDNSSLVDARHTDAFLKITPAQLVRLEIIKAVAAGPGISTADMIQRAVVLEAYVLTGKAEAKG